MKDLIPMLLEMTMLSWHTVLRQWLKIVQIFPLLHDHKIKFRAPQNQIMSYIWMSCCIVVPHSRWSRRYLKLIIPSKTAVFLQCTINSIIPRQLCKLVLQLLLVISQPGALLEALLNRSPLSRFESTVCEDIGSLHFYH